MWIFRFTYCLIQGHAYLDIVTTSGRPYQYCLHCGKTRESSDFIKNQAGQFIDYQ